MKQIKRLSNLFALFAYSGIVMIFILFLAQVIIERHGTEALGWFISQITRISGIFVGTALALIILHWIITTFDDMDIDAEGSSPTRETLYKGYSQLEARVTGVNWREHVNPVPTKMKIIDFWHRTTTRYLTTAICIFTILQTGIVILTPSRDGERLNFQWLGEPIIWAFIPVVIVVIGSVVFFVKWCLDTAQTLRGL